jgi:hypothetical protein
MRESIQSSSRPSAMCNHPVLDKSKVNGQVRVSSLSQKLDFCKMEFQSFSDKQLPKPSMDSTAAFLIALYIQNHSFKKNMFEVSIFHC